MKNYSRNFSARWANGYNRGKRRYEKIPPHPNSTEIFKIITRNYEILKKGIPGQIEERYSTVCGTTEFIASGIDLRFYTSSFESEGKDWKCLFDHCYCLQPEHTEILFVRQKAEL
ncbi:hypothetical protein [Pedobacter antarcticus]|uniref:hypothetical protein n=1 Tax=Pedobacter antarcticus TaxID=34086 RepID=UPI00292EC2F5|nr:hypothetical protein [Pedobacter antarcticus]